MRKVFPNPEALFRLAGAVLVEFHDGWAATGRRYLCEGSMKLRTAVPAALLATFTLGVALVMAAGTEVAYSNEWSGGEALPEPGPFLLYDVVIGVLLGVGALVGAFAGGARIRRSDQGKWRLR